MGHPGPMSVSTKKSKGKNENVGNEKHCEEMRLNKRRGEQNNTTIFAIGLSLSMYFNLK